MMVMDVGYQFSNKVESGERDIDFAFFLMVFIPEGDDVINERSDSGLRDGGSFCVAADVFDNFFCIGKFFADMDIPLDGGRVGFV